MDWMRNNKKKPLAKFCKISFNSFLDSASNGDAAVTVTLISPREKAIALLKIRDIDGKYFIRLFSANTDNKLTVISSRFNLD